MELTPQCYWEFVALENYAARLLKRLESPKFGKRHLAFVICGIDCNLSGLRRSCEVMPAVSHIYSLCRKCRRLDEITGETREVLRVGAQIFQRRLESLAYLKERWVPELANVPPVLF